MSADDDAAAQTLLIATIDACDVLSVLVKGLYRYGLIVCVYMCVYV